MERQGSFSRVIRWRAGWHPDIGTLHQGWQGKETVEQTYAVKPKGVVIVTKNK